MERIGDLAYNPVREHIRMRFRQVKDERQRVEAVVDDLETQGFDPALSRVLVFVRTRQQAEDTAVALSQLARQRGLAWAGQVDFFHAGLDGTERSTRYEAYKSAANPALATEADEEEDSAAPTLVLVATKAFGMGMDIPNIHYLYHLGPSGTFEDFLQEVGRAGRSAQLYQQAGFSAEQKIETLCVLTKADFSLLRDLLHKSDLTWSYLLDTQRLLHEHLRQMGRLHLPMREPYALPLDLSQSGLADATDGGVRFRLALHWLEELGRLRLGMFTLTHLPLTLCPAPDYGRLKLAAERQRVQQFVAALHALPFRSPGSASLNLPLDELQRLAGEKHLNEAFSLLFKAQRAGAVLVDRPLWLGLTRKRRPELKRWHEAGTPAHQLPLVEALFDLARRLLQLLPAGGGQRRIEPAEWDELVGEVAAEHFTPDHVRWHDLGAKKQELTIETTCRRLARDWQQTRARFALNLIRLLPGFSTKTLLDLTGDNQGERVQVIGSEQGGAKQWATPLADLCQHLASLLRLVAGATTTKFNYADVVLTLELETRGSGYLDHLLFLARSLGYLKTIGSLLPAGIELSLDSLTPPDADERVVAENRRVSDYQVHQQFEEGRQLRQLRLLALECLSGLPAARQDEFIKQYFTCEGSAALVGLLGAADYLGEGHPTLQAYRGEALLEEEARLNPQQRAVYDAPLDQHLQVIAGPGSGKTHTLTLRVARLIHRERKDPAEIVVLAYNRAVVLELKDRLTRLFQRLGYGRLVSRLHVYTFHGFCQRLVGEQLRGRPFDEWVGVLRQNLAEQPTLLETTLGQVPRFVFVDEFQDITTERLEVLHLLAPPGQARLCVIGDPNQSIYGYERAAKGDPMDPHPYYKQLFRLYEHGEPYYLTDNYRSYPAILDAATTLLVRNPSRFKHLPPLRAQRELATTHDYCEVVDARDQQAGHWHDKLRQLLAEVYDPGPDSQGRPQPPRPYQQVAVMLRSNDEVFRAYAELDKLGVLGEGVVLRVQGASGSPVATREFRELLQPFYAAPDAVLAPDFMAAFNREKEALLARYGQVWNPYLVHLMHCLLYEFKAEHERQGDPLETATHQELLDFITDLARHDDGHFAKLYGKHIRAAAPHEPERREVVLTTMHRVKGLEFDAVLLPPSFMDFAQGVPEARLAETVEEERRLLYVAYTRARYRLVVFNFERELAVAEGRPFALDAAKRQRLGVSIKEGPGKVQLYWWAMNGREPVYQTILEQLKVGQPITLAKDSRGNWLLEWQGIAIGRLGGIAAGKLPTAERLTGLVVAHVACHPLADSLAYDAQHGTAFAEKWGAAARARGYVYTVDFAGYYQQA